MSNAEYASLIDFLSGKFERIDARFDAIDRRLDSHGQRLTRLEVSFEEFRHDMKAVTELARQNGELARQNAGRLDRIERLIA